MVAQAQAHLATVNGSAADAEEKEIYSEAAIENALFWAMRTRKPIDLRFRVPVQERTGKEYAVQMRKRDAATGKRKTVLRPASPRASVRVNAIVDYGHAFAFDLVATDGTQYNSTTADAIACYYRQPKADAPAAQEEEIEVED